jgi:hypothetical protein
MTELSFRTAQVSFRITHFFRTAITTLQQHLRIYTASMVLWCSFQVLQ